MNIKKLDGGNLEIFMTATELGWLRQSLNECCNGLVIKDFRAAIGVEEDVPLHFLDQMRPLFRAPVGYEG